MPTKYKKIILYVVSIGIIYLCCGKAIADDTIWDKKKSRHFIVYHQDAPAEYLKQLIIKAEDYYGSITDYLGYRRFNFWLWDNRCKIYLYPDREAYLKTAKRASWSRAHVDVLKKEIITYIWQENFFDTILPHEMGHIVFREFVGFNKGLPLFLDEGIACMQEQSKQERLDIAKVLIAWNLHIPVDNLFKLRSDSVIIPFIFYSESASIVNFLIEKFGKELFVFFCRRLRDGQNYEEALTDTYKFSDLGKLEDSWINYITNN